jgi:hypothetical protein
MINIFYIHVDWFLSVLHSPSFFSTTTFRILVLILSSGDWIQWVHVWQLLFQQGEGNSTAYFILWTGQETEGISETTWLQENARKMDNVPNFNQSVCHALTYRHAHKFIHEDTTLIRVCIVYRPGSSSKHFIYSYRISLLAKRCRKNTGNFQLKIIRVFGNSKECVTSPP